MNPENYSNLKARLYDLLVETEKKDARIAELEKGIKEREKHIDDVRGDLNSALNVAKRRSEMIRELTRTNNGLRDEMKESKVTLSPEIIDEMTKVLKRHIEPPTKIGVPVKSGFGGFNF